MYHGGPRRQLRLFFLVRRHEFLVGDQNLGAVDLTRNHPFDEHSVLYLLAVELLERVDREIFRLELTSERLFPAYRLPVFIDRTVDGIYNLGE